jgi:phosphoribosylaminoimidazolecarboxamide formyltransferase/IMP cyclohydrolase
MEIDIPIQRALISVSNKTGVVPFVKALATLDIEIISTGGTAVVLEKAGVRVTKVESLTGFPEMLDGRVKTLHPAIHGALLGIRSEPSHVQALEQHGIKPIDLICIDLYPFKETMQKHGVSTEEVIEQIDIGGPAMIRSAAKNHRFVTVVTDPKQYPQVLADLDANQGATTFALRSDLARDAFACTADYDTIINHWMEDEFNNQPTRLRVCGTLEQTLRYGENPDQEATVYSDGEQCGPNVVTASVIAGKPLSYNNLIDAAGALELMQDLHEATAQPTAIIVKHTNACGAAVSTSIGKSFSCAWQGDPLAAFGGIVALSHPVDLDLARRICDGEKFLEVIVAPLFSSDGAAALSERWKNIRLLAVGKGDRKGNWRQLRSIQGGILVQTCKPVTADAATWTHITGPEPTKTQLLDGVVAWITCAYLKSNAISIVSDGILIGGGMGQVDRLCAARLAIQRAGDRLVEASSAVAASDAFFPFADGPELLIDAGVRCIIQPGGSVRDQETIDLCQSRNITLLHTGTRCFRH